MGHPLEWDYEIFYNIYKKTYFKRDRGALEEFLKRQRSKLMKRKYSKYIYKLNLITLFKKDTTDNKIDF